MFYTSNKISYETLVTSLFVLVFSRTAYLQERTNKKSCQNASVCSYSGLLATAAVGLTDHDCL